MIDILDNIKQFLANLQLAAGRSNDNGIRLRFGNVEAMLLPRSTLLIRGKFAAIDREAGFSWVRRKGSFYIRPRLESNPHIVISGMSGFGKSTLFKSLLLDIVNCKLPCLIFDAHNEHGNIVRSLGGSDHNAIYSGINILELDGASVSERISELSRLFKEIYSLGYVQTTKLSECLWYTYRKAGARSRSDRTLNTAPTVKDLVDELNIFIKNARGVGERNTLMHLKDRISLLNSTAFTGSFITMRQLQEGLHSFSLANIKSREAQLIYIGELLSRIYSMMHDSERHNALRLYIMIDEAQFLTDNSGSNSIISKLIEEGRKYGIGVIMVTHAASTLNRKIIANASTFVSFYARDPMELSFVTKLLSGNNTAMIDAVRNRINVLRQNQVLLISSVMRSPVLISTPRFDEINIARPEPDVEDVKDMLSVKAKRPAKLSDMQQSDQNITSIIQVLVKEGFLDYFKDDYDNGVEWIMHHNASLSLEHEIWVARISEAIGRAGIENRVIDNSNGPDISVSTGNRRIAIEYETGRKAMESTSKMITSRFGQYSQVIVVTRPELVGYYRDCIKEKEVLVIGTDTVGTLAATLTRSMG